MFDIDRAQWRVMHSQCFKNMMRSSGAMRLDRRSEAVPQRDEMLGFLWSLLSFGVMSLVVASLVYRLQYPVGELIAISFLSLLVFAGVSGQCSSVLFTKKEQHVFGALPISASTHLASKVTGSITYYSLVCGGVAVPAFFVILLTDGLFAGVSWVVSIAVCIWFLCFAAIWTHSLSVRIFAGSKLRYVWSILGTVFSLIVVGLVFIAMLRDYELGRLGESWNLTDNPLLLLFPPYWYVALLLFLDGQSSTTIFVGTLLAAFGSIPIGFYLFKRVDAAFLAALNDPTFHINETHSSPFAIALFRSLKFGSLGYERVAVWKLAFSHMRYDSIFRSTVTLYFTLFFVWVVIFIGGEDRPELFGDPFQSPDPDARWLLVYTCCMLFLFVFGLFEAVRSSTYSPACWIFFVSPSKLTRFGAMVVDWIFFVFVVPVLLLLFVFFSFHWQTPINALMHVTSLGWLAYFAINLKSIINPDLPFARHTSSSGPSARFCLNFVLIIIGGIVIYHSFASWMYKNLAIYIASILSGILICVAVRYLTHVRHDRKFLNTDLVT
ncbi:MAG: hypothetical protein OXG25_08420 [Gammaproteobacteria bacterium]|nr:hypothetical protein [Gammaproteobacteria bacterium]